MVSQSSFGSLLKLRSICDEEEIADCGFRIADLFLDFGFSDFGLQIGTLVSASRNPTPNLKTKINKSEILK
jgi:hypothetical protein